MSNMIESLVKNRIFPNEEDVIKTLLGDYIIRQIGNQKRETKRFERKYGMSFERFKEYLHERSNLLRKGDLSRQERQTLAQAIIQEEGGERDVGILDRITPGGYTLTSLASLLGRLVTEFQVHPTCRKVTVCDRGGNGKSSDKKRSQESLR